MKSKLVQDILNSTYDKFDIDAILSFDIDNFMVDLKSYDQAMDYMQVAEYAFDCYETNRFMPVENEHQLEAQALNLSKNASFFAGKKILGIYLLFTFTIKFDVSHFRNCIPQWQ